MDVSNATLKSARASKRSVEPRTHAQPRRKVAEAGPAPAAVADAPTKPRRTRARASSAAVAPAATPVDDLAPAVEAAFAGHPAVAADIPDGPLAGRLRALFDARIEPMPHDSFDDPAAEAEILGPLPASEAKAGRRPSPPEGVPPYLASLYDTPLLSREQEAHLFRKMNFLKHRAARLRSAIDPARATEAQVEAVERALAESVAVKNQIIRANLRLVVSIAKRHVSPMRSLFELVSDGNMSLMRAVEKFDYARGNKFSTYATWAIKRNFSRSIPEEDRRRDRFVTGYEEMFEGAADGRAGENELEDAQRRARETVEGMLGRLDERERRILTSHYGLGGASEQTLEQLGKELGITKERVRQIESRAQDKLRKIAHAERLDDLKIA